MLHFGLAGVKHHKIFFLPTYKSVIKYDPGMQLSLIFHKKVNRNKLKVRKFQSHRLSSFSAIKKIVIRVQEGVSSLYSYHCLRLYNFHYKLSSHKSLIITVKPISSTALLNFSYLHVQCFSFP